MRTADRLGSVYVPEARDLDGAVGEGVCGEIGRHTSGCKGPLKNPRRLGDS